MKGRAGKCSFLVLLGILSACRIYSQTLFVSKFIPGNYLSDNNHLVEITNSSAAAINISGYLLVTRDYSVRLPSGTSVPANGTIRIVKKRTGNESVGVELSRVPDFLIRIRDRQIEGNYVALLDKNRRSVSAFYHSPIRSVPFLPDKDTLITINKEIIPFSLPDESGGTWGFLNSVEDPAIAFVREGNAWRYGSAKSARPAVDYRNLNLRYHDGVVTVKWTTGLEQGAKIHLIERSEDQQNFEVIDRVEAAGTSGEIRQYTAYDATVQQGKVYYYRIRNRDIQGREAVSKIASLKAEEGKSEFSLDVFLTAESQTAGLNVRFFSAFSQKVKIKLLDAQYREVAILFNDYVYAETGNLLKITKALPAGNYLIVADTETKRFSKTILIK